MNELEVVLAEYRTLRDEILRKFDLHLQIYSVYTSGLLVFYGLMFVHKVYDVITVVPFFALCFVLRILWEQSLIRKISEYILLEIERNKIPMLVGMVSTSQSQNANYTNLWMGWQHFYAEKTSGPKYYKHSMLVLFVLLSAAPAIIYNLYSIFGILTLLDVPIVTKLAVEIHMFLLALNLMLCSWMTHRIIRM